MATLIVKWSKWCKALLDICSKSALNKTRRHIGNRTCIATGKSFWASGGKKTSVAFFGNGWLPCAGCPTSITWSWLEKETNRNSSITETWSKLQKTNRLKISRVQLLVSQITFNNKSIDVIHQILPTRYESLFITKGRDWESNLMIGQMIFVNRFFSLIRLYWQLSILKLMEIYFV